MRSPILNAEGNGYRRLLSNVVHDVHIGTERARVVVMTSLREWRQENNGARSMEGAVRRGRRLASVLAVGLLAGVGSYGTTVEAAPPPVYTSLVPSRLMDTRADGLTVDGESQALGAVAAGSVTELVVADRGGVSADAMAVALNVTAVNPLAQGFITVFPCGATQPDTSNLNYRAGQRVANAVVAAVGTDGKVCIYSKSITDLVVDLSGYFPVNSAFVTVAPARLLESRSTGLTVDGQSQATGSLAAGSVTELVVGGRATIDAAAGSAVLNVTVVDALGQGFITVFPCGATQPGTSNLNFVAGQRVANAVVSKLGTDGKVCIYTKTETHLVVDVSGYVPVTDKYKPITPSRLMDTRLDGITVDGKMQAQGVRLAGTVTQLDVTDRGGTKGSKAVVLNVTSVNSTAAGFITVFPCGTTQPNTSSVNYTAGQVVANTVIAKVGSGGKVCIYTKSDTDVVVDVSGYMP